MSLVGNQNIQVMKCLNKAMIGIVSIDKILDDKFNGSHHQSKVKQGILNLFSELL